MSDLFNKGYKSVRQEKERQDQVRENSGKKLWRFFIAKDGEEATIRFLTEEPITFYEHTLQRGSKFENEICVGNDCPFCEDGDRPSFKGAYLIYDKRPYSYTDSKGNKQSGEGQLRLYVQGTRVLSQLDRLSSKYGLTGRDYIVSRSGQGTSTTYMFERDDEYNMSEAQIRNILPDKLKEEYNGKISSLEAIVKNQLEDTIPDSVTAPKLEEKDSDTDDGYVAVDDDYIDVEDTPKPLKKKAMPQMRKRVENSIKPKKSAKEIFKK